MVVVDVSAWSAKAAVEEERPNIRAIPNIAIFLNKIESSCCHYELDNKRKRYDNQLNQS